MTHGTELRKKRAKAIKKYPRQPGGDKTLSG
jgi:hypothetical protein